VAKDADAKRKKRPYLTGLEELPREGASHLDLEGADYKETNVGY